MVERWNAVVKPDDHVYHLGDVVIAKRGLEFVRRLNGRKRLIRGNHDIFSDDLYREVGFEQIHGVRVFVDKFILSHIPLHPDCVTERFKVNVHGHLHANEVMENVDHFEDRELCDLRGSGTSYENVYLYSEQRIDPRYMSACVELNNYTPVSFEELEVKIQKRWSDCDYQPPKGYFNGPGPS